MIVIINSFLNYCLSIFGLFFYFIMCSFFNWRLFLFQIKPSPFPLKPIWLSISRQPLGFLLVFITLFLFLSLPLSPSSSSFFLSLYFSNDSHQIHGCLEKYSCFLLHFLWNRLHILRFFRGRISWPFSFFQKVSLYI